MDTSPIGFTNWLSRYCRTSAGQGANIEAKDEQGRSALELAEKGTQLWDWTWKRRKIDQVIEFLKKWSSAKNSQSDFSHKRKLDGNEEKEKKIPKTSVQTLS